MKFWFERGAWASRKAKRNVASLDRNDVCRIAVIRHAALGDMILLRPFLGEARRFFPNAKIVLSLVSNYTYGAPIEMVDEVHVLPGTDQQNTSVIDQYKAIKRLGNVDILFDFADTNRSRYLSLLSRAKLKIGFPYRWYLRNLLFDAAVLRSDFAFEATNMLDALMLLGAKPEVPPNFFWPSIRPELESARQYVVYFPFASIESKSWPEQNFKDLVSLLAQRYKNVNHVVLGGLSVRESVKTYKPLNDRFSNVSLQCALPLDDVLTFLRQATLVVSNDTGVRNAAIALGVPTVGIFFSTVPFRYWPRAQNHETVFEPSGSIPNVSDVFSVVESSLRKLGCVDG